MGCPSVDGVCTYGLGVHPWMGCAFMDGVCIYECGVCLWMGYECM